MRAGGKPLRQCRRGPDDQSWGASVDRHCRAAHNPLFAPTPAPSPAPTTMAAARLLPTIPARLAFVPARAAPRRPAPPAAAPGGAVERALGLKEVAAAAATAAGLTEKEATAAVKGALDAIMDQARGESGGETRGCGTQRQRCAVAAMCRTARPPRRGHSPSPFSPGIGRQPRHHRRRMAGGIWKRGAWVGRRAGGSAQRAPGPSCLSPPPPPPGLIPRLWLV